ncbi:MAG: TIR domain-containing protein [Myxococcales bacterium]
MTAAPKLFISYCWTSPEHQERVLRLATELRDAQVDVILDIWDLKEGHDLYAFMESMVTNPEVQKVLMICNKEYVERADGRHGGVGAETTILTPDLYGKRDQSKYVALVLDRDADDHAMVPAYYKARIFIDFTDPDKQADSFERLLRWVFDKPLYEKPALGKRPAFLDDASDGPRMRTSTQARRASTAVRDGRSNAAALTAEYLNTFAHELESFRLRRTEPIDDAVVANITDFIHYRNELVRFVDELALHCPGEQTANLLHRFLEKLLPYNRRPEGVTSWYEADFDNFRFITHEIFLYVIAALLRHERFAETAKLLATEYYCAGDRNDVVSYTEFYEPVRSLDARKKQGRSERLSVQADLLKERCTGLPVAFTQLMQADFVLYLRGHLKGGYWWPVTLVYVARFAPRFEMFARARSRSYFERLRIVLGADKVEQLHALEADLKSGKSRAPTWGGWETLDVAALMNASEIATRE